jgi:hypothetical protein
LENDICFLFFDFILYRNFEIRDIADIDEIIKNELNESPSDCSTPLSSSSAANVVHSKPQRPGRGKVKISKFNSDGDQV